MQQITDNLFIETSYSGPTLGVINWSHGLILIDAPFRSEDIRSWRSALLSMGKGVERLLINMDAHLDRTLGARAMDCTVIGHEKIVEVFRSRPITFKAQSYDSGAEWEQFEGLGSTRWAPPEITFTDNLAIHLNTGPICLKYSPGSAAGAIWIDLPEDQILFVGDAVVSDQPPFLASSDIKVWVEKLRVLLTPKYEGYRIIGGRNSDILPEQVHIFIKYLLKIEHHLNRMAEKGAQPSEIDQLIPELLMDFNIRPEREAMFLRRMRWGLQQYYVRHYASVQTGAISLEE